MVVNQPIRHRSRTQHCNFLRFAQEGPVIMLNNIMTGPSGVSDANLVTLDLGPMTCKSCDTGPWAYG